MSVQQTIEQKLNDAFNVSFLQIDNESHMHSGPASESHFKVVLVTDDFADMNKVKMHQAVYKVLAEELAGSVHALALHTYDQASWQNQAPGSPQCMGGSKK